MSYAVRRPSRSSGQASAEAPTTAMVLDYSCLFTHDLRRKQKRWQDGRLKFHTFNKRIMVYDDRGNFIGDSHWHSGGTLDEGEELELDRGSAIVQVADCTGSREQDLTELLDKRAREVEQRRASAAARTTPAKQTPARRREGQPQPHFQLKHRPLSAIVPSPGPIGRAAISDRSPFEARRAEAGGEQWPPATKKRRVSASPPSKKGFAQNLFGAKLTLSSCPPPTSTPSATARLSKAGPDAMVEEPARSRDVGESDDDVVLLDGPPPERPNPSARPAQPKSRSAKEIPVATSRDTSRKPRNVVDIDTATTIGSRPSHRDGSPSLHALGRARPAARLISKEREKTDNRVGAAVSTMNETRQAIPQEPLSLEAGEAVEQRSLVEKSPDIVPSSKGKGLAGRSQDTTLTREQSWKSEKPEPRTELRIKPRKRRGLLMMSEQVQTSRDARVRQASRPAASGSSPVASPVPEPRKTHHQREPSEEQGMACAGIESGSCAAPALVDASSEIDAIPVKARQRGRIASVSTGCDSDEEVLSMNRRRRGDVRQVQESDDDGSDNQGCRPTRARSGGSRHTRPSSEDESDSLSEPPSSKPNRRSSRRKHNREQEMEKPAPSGPRLTKMARKSVKSREIIGYIPPAEEAMVPALFAVTPSRCAFGVNPASSEGSMKASAACDRTTMGKRSAANADDVVVAAMPAIEPPKAPAMATMGEPPVPDKEAAREQERRDADGGTRPRIQNPATRGKKAARKKDAAGHALQNPVPMEPAAPTRAAEVAPAEAKKDQASLPGFSRANGGAWSKHAEDLLGMTRPARRTRGG